MIHLVLLELDIKKTKNIKQKVGIYFSNYQPGVSTFHLSIPVCKQHIRIMGVLFIKANLIIFHIYIKMTVFIFTDSKSGIWINGTE